MAVGNWTNLGNNIWQADCPACGDRVTGVYRDNAALPLGRYPNLDASNKGYITVQSHSGRSQLTSQVGLSTNWTGGEVVFRPVQWILNRSKITGQSGNTLYLDGSGSYDISDNWGFFVQNHPATLDQVGEWYYNPGNKTIRIYDNQGNLNSQTVTATTSSEAVNLANVSFVTIRNLQITQALATNLVVTNSSNLVISNNDITQAGEDGIVLQGSGSQITFENNNIDNINNNGVAISTYQNITFRGNNVRNIGLLPGRGKSGDGMYVGFQSNSTANTLIENNTFDNIGYVAINFSTSSTIQRNLISNFCLTKSDGSALYIWNGNRLGMSDIRILSNTVYNGIGANEGTPGGTYTGANGIYLDDCTTNIEVANNTVYNCKGYGIFLHGSSNVRVTGNTAYNNDEGQLSITPASGCQPRSNAILNNVFVSRVADQYNVKYESGQNDLGEYGQFDNNAYIRPFAANNPIFYYNGSSGGNISLAEWRNRYGKDASSMISPVTYSSGNPDDYIKFIPNPTGSSIQASLNGTYRDAKNNTYSGQVTVPAYSSLVLLRDITQSLPLRDPDNPANTVAGLNYSYYESFWTSLPDFNSLTPVKSDVTSTPTLSVRNRDTSYGLRFTGYISVPTDGQYTFYLNSDDGSKLYIGSTEVVDNGTFTGQEKSGTIGLKAGLHAITVSYFQGGGGASLSVSYSGPNIGKQVIPASAWYRVNTGTTTPTTPTTGLRDADNPANAVVGLNYSYYESYWTTLPDFNSLTPTKSGTTSVPSLSVRNREESYGLRFTGYINVPTDGQYTFYTSSDDGTKLYIGSTEVVSNDGVHADQERSGTIGLKAGLHAITVVYFQGNGGAALSVSYSGPNIGKQTIPASAWYRVNTGTTTPTTPTTGLRDADNPANAVVGLNYSYYESYWTTLPDFNSLTPTKSGTTSVPSLSVRNREESYGLRFTGYISVPTDGQYTFYLNSDDGSKLYIGSTEVVDNGTFTGQEKSGTIGLKAGLHAITVSYFQGGGGASLSVSYSGPNIGKQVIPASAWYRVNTGTTTPTTPTTGLRDADNPANAVVGLNYSYYESYWTTLPDFNSLTPTKSGTTSVPSLSVRNREESYGLRFTGYINVPTDGQYTFYTSSDDGTKLYIGSTEVVSNDGVHADQERSGTIGLKAGLHAITVVYFQGNGGAALSVSYSGPNIGKQVIPASAWYRVNTGTTTPTTPTTGLRDADNPANAVVGLNYSYYESYWTTLPDFNSLTPTKSGTTSVPSLSVRNREESYGLRFTGYINVPTDGQYTFYTSSDDGTKLYIGSTEVVSNDGVHADQERSGTIGLKAGLHAITVVYFQGNGGAALSVSYSGPNIGKQTIPASAWYRVNTGTTTTTTPTTGLRDADNPANAVVGLNYSYYESYWTTLPDFNSLTPTKSGTTSVPSLSVRNREESYGIRFTGYISVPTDGQYTFYTSSDDGTKLYIGSTEVVSNDGVHGDQEKSGTIGLKAGLHAITVVYFQGGGGAALSVSYSGPNIGKQNIPASAFRRVTSGGREAAVGEVTPEITFQMQAYPIPAQDNMWIRYSTENAGDVTVQLINMAAQEVMQTTYQAVKGENLIKIGVGQFNRGGYVLTLTQGQQRLTSKVLFKE
ncbi:PA14 domain-containing protein [Spirosoma oryzicola]|uniref:PA14 domain-containing protein n=1 Tax=Spirosoma oryzicola TaxID=2898794 RepID=UPI001E5EE3E9|nr:PA14 domain-containing protein [Spirosoma oryzicola]UHG90354.1 PA14 domain-containing protein [Spirosoma oryzicola]